MEPAGAEPTSDDEKDDDKLARWQINPSALVVLQTCYQMEPFPTTEVRKQLAAKLKVHPRQVQTWFQNRRARERRMGGTVLKPGGNSAATGSLSSAPASTDHAVASSSCSADFGRPRDVQTSRDDDEYRPSIDPRTVQGSSFSSLLPVSSNGLAPLATQLHSSLVDSMGLPEATCSGLKRPLFDPLPLPLTSLRRRSLSGLGSGTCNRGAFSGGALSVATPAPAPVHLPGPMMRMVVAATPPHCIISTTKPWLDLMSTASLDERDATSATVAVLRSDADESGFQNLLANLKEGKEGTLVLHSSTSQQQLFKHEVDVQPLYDGHRAIRCFMLTSTLLDPPAGYSLAQPQAQASNPATPSTNSYGSDGPDHEMGSVPVPPPALGNKPGSGWATSELYGVHATGSLFGEPAAVGGHGHVDPKTAVHVAAAAQRLMMQVDAAARGSLQEEADASIVAGIIDSVGDDDEQMSEAGSAVLADMPDKVELLEAILKM